MNQNFLLAALAAFALVAIACTDDEAEQPASEPTQTATSSTATTTATPRAPEGTTTVAPDNTPRAAQTPTASPTTTATPLATLVPLQLPDRLPGGIEPLPPDTRTGILELDRVIEALVAGDDATLIELVAWELVPCSARSGLPSPPRCPAGIAEGTPVEAIYWGGNEGSHRTRASLEASGIFVIPTFSEDERSLCHISQNQRDDGTPEYRVSMRAATSDPAYDSYQLNGFAVVVVAGQITTVAHQVDPGASLDDAICR